MHSGKAVKIEVKDQAALVEGGFLKLPEGLEEGTVLVTTDDGEATADGRTVFLSDVNVLEAEYLIDGQRYVACE